MGCSQSKANDVVVEPITAPPSECGKASMDLAFTEIIVDDHEDTSTSVPPAPVEEELEEEEEEQEIAAPAEEEPVTEQPVEIVEGPVVAEVEVLEEPAVELEQEHPIEPEVEAEDAVELQVEKSAVSAVEKSAVSVVEMSAVTSVHTPVWTFVADNVSFTVGVAFFNIAGSTAEGDEAYLTKRYSDFKVLHADMAKFMTKEELPGMSGTSFLQGRNNKALLQERETAFVKMLNAIAQHPEASQSAPFAAFLA